MTAVLILTTTIAMLPESNTGYEYSKGLKLGAASYPPMPDELAVKAIAEGWAKPDRGCESYYDRVLAELTASLIAVDIAPESIAVGGEDAAVLASEPAPLEPEAPAETAVETPLPS